MLFGIVFGAIVLGIIGERVRASYVAAERRLEWRRKNKHDWRRKPDAGTRDATAAVRGEVRSLPAFDAAEQLRCVMAARFDKRPLLNKSERRILAAAERAARDLGQGWRVMAQVCLGEVLASPDEAAYRAINSKRVDLLIIGRDSAPLAAIEYQGGGHHQGTAAARDAVKKEALRRAGIDYIEIKAGDRTADLNWAIAKLAQGTGA